MRGAWIEISASIQPPKSPASLPVRGAWIEIPAYFALLGFVACRSPCGERGLKFKINVLVNVECKVAPRAGSVD